MRKSLFVFLLAIPVFFSQPGNAQEIYPISSWENLFQWAEVGNSPQAGTNINEGLRYTLVLNVGQYWHADFTNNIGLYTGLAVRNVGFIYDTDIPTKTIRRSYTVGVPLSLKLGVFDKHLYIFGGGEYELLFHYKGKRWLSNDRNGSKIKDTEWFSSKTKRLAPSVFAGIQLPGGIHLRYKYYLDHFLNENYVGSDLGQAGVDFGEYKPLQMHYISVCWQFRTDHFSKYIPTEKTAYNH